MSIFNGNCGGGGGSAVIGAHASTHGTGGSDQITPAMISAAPASHTHTPAQVGIPNPEVTTNKNVANGYAGLNASGQVPAALLPSYVDDIVEAANLAALPATGDASAIYVTLDTGKAYRWGGSAYAEIPASPGSTDSVTEGSVNLYFTSARAAAAQVNADWNSASGKSQILNKPTLGTASSKDVAATGNALAGQVVLGNDTRLSDPRTPIPHTHPQSEVTGLVDALAASTRAPALARSSANALAAATGMAPSFYVNMLDYAHTETGVPPGMRFTRGCKRTVFDPNWLLREVPANVLRHSWHPNTGVYEGALFEANNENLLPMSDTLTGTSWISVGVDVVPNSGMCPDGSNSATLLKDVSTVGDRGYHETSFPIPADDATYMASIFVCNPGSGKFRFSVYFHNGTIPAPRDFHCEIDWASMSISGGYLIPINNNWYRLVLTVSNAGYNTCIFRVYPTNDDPGLTGQALVWGAQFERGPYLSNFNYPAGTGWVGNLLKNPDQLDSPPWSVIGISGLVPGYSSPLGPVGWLFSDLDPIGGGALLSQQGVVILPDQEEYTFSVYLKKGSFPGNILEFCMYSKPDVPSTWKYLQMRTDWNTFSVSLIGNLTAVSHSFTSAGDGWYRAVCTIKNQGYSFASMNIYPCLGGANQTGSVYVASPRIEKSSTPGSTSSEFPDSDVLVKTSIDRIIAGDRGTMIVEVSSHGEKDIANLRESSNSRITVRGDSFQICPAPGVVFSLPVNSNSRVYAFTWDETSAAGVTDLTPLQTMTGFTLPSVTTFSLGGDGVSSQVNSMHGGLLMFAYIPARLPDAALNALVG